MGLSNHYPMLLCDAAYGGHSDVIMWLISRGSAVNADVLAHVAAGGHLELLRWARQNGYPWDAGVCSGAAA